METTVLDSTLVGALLVVPVVLLTGLCLSCRKHSHTSIQQNYDVDDDTQYFPAGSGGFRIVRPAGPVLPASTNPFNMSESSGHSSHLLSPISPLLHQSRHSSFVPTEDGSIPSYENQESPHGVYVDDKEDDDAPGYIEVLPDPPVCKSVCASHQSLASVQSSGTGELDYVNVDSDTASEKNYINVKDEPFGLFPDDILASLPACAIKPLQLVQNAAARLITSRPRSAHVTPLLIGLHWLPIATRIRLKALVLAFQAAKGTARPYTVELHVHACFPFRFLSGGMTCLPLSGQQNPSPYFDAD
ncbi:linker for activation of T-cells family member 1-like isoform X2 [Conger conger]|nr:linker for activation of T-cells family member 1-like isoform X2 [Conger conger]